MSERSSAADWLCSCLSLSTDDDMLVNISMHHQLPAQSCCDIFWMRYENEKGLCLSSSSKVEPAALFGRRAPGMVINCGVSEVPVLQRCHSDKQHNRFICRFPELENVNLWRLCSSWRSSKWIVPKPGCTGSVLFLVEWSPTGQERKVGNYCHGEEHGYNQKYLFDSFIDFLRD